MNLDEILNIHVSWVWQGLLLSMADALTTIFIVKWLFTLQLLKFRSLPWFSMLRLFIAHAVGVTGGAYISFSLPSHTSPQTQWVLLATPIVQTRPLPQSMNATLPFWCMLTTETLWPLRVLRMLKTVVSQNAQKAKPIQNFGSIIFWRLCLIEGSDVTIAILVFSGFEVC